MKKRLSFGAAFWMVLLSICLAACGGNSVRGTRQECSPQAESEASQADPPEAEESSLSEEMTEPRKDTEDLVVATAALSDDVRGLPADTAAASSAAQPSAAAEAEESSKAAASSSEAAPAGPTAAISLSETAAGSAAAESTLQAAASSAAAASPSKAAPSAAPPSGTVPAKPPAPVPTSKAAPESSSVSAPAKPPAPPSPCRHHYRSTVIREADCAYPGLRVYSCTECGKQYEESIPATGIHHWRALTKTVHHDARTYVVHHEAQSHTEWIVDEEAWEEPVTELHSFCNGCGEDLTVLLKTGQIEDYSDHALQHVEKGEMAPGYHMEEVVIELIYHEEIGHEETVIDVPAWDETVILEPAWDETQVCGHVCTVCGKITEE